MNDFTDFMGNVKQAQQRLDALKDEAISIFRKALDNDLNIELTDGSVIVADEFTEDYFDNLSAFFTPEDETVTIVRIGRHRKQFFTLTMGKLKTLTEDVARLEDEADAEYIMYLKGVNKITKDAGITAMDSFFSAEDFIDSLVPQTYGAENEFIRFILNKVWGGSIVEVGILESGIRMTFSAGHSLRMNYENLIQLVNKAVLAQASNH